MAKPEPKKPKKPTIPQIADLIARPVAESTGARRGTPAHAQRTMSASLPAAKALARVTEWSQPHAAEMARIYESLPVMQPEARSAYEQMAREVDDQFERMKQAGIKVEFTDADPYKTSREMMDDVKAGRLKVFRTPEDFGHPFLTREQNDKFRAVHDYFGHAGEGHQFGPKGEENAFRVHSEMFSPEARRAMATETRGQNSWFNAGPHAHLPPSQRPFAQQKGALWPEEWLGEYPALPKSPEAKLGGAADLVAERRKLRDRTAQEIRQRRKIEREANVNPLTGVGNRRAFEQARARVDADPNLEWASLDVNHLKATNDKLGHEAGDTLLKRAAQTLREQPGVQQVFHHGGDEMAIVTRKGEAQRVVDEVGKMDLLPAFTHNGRTIRPSISGHVGATYSEADAGVQAVKQARKQSERAAALAGEPAPIYGGFDKPGPKKETLWDIAKKVISNERGSIKALPDDRPLFDLSKLGKGGGPLDAVPQEKLRLARPDDVKNAKRVASRQETFDNLVEDIYRNIGKSERRGAVERGVEMGGHNFYDMNPVVEDMIAVTGEPAARANFDLLTKLIGGTSPSAAVPGNVARSLLLHPKVRAGQLDPAVLRDKAKFTGGVNAYLPKGVQTIASKTQGDMVTQILRDQPWRAASGQAKLASFDANTAGNFAPFTGDRHAARISFDDKSRAGFSPLEYAAADAAWTTRAEEAAKRGAFPVQPGKSPVAPYQGVMWMGDAPFTGVASDPRALAQVVDDQMGSFASQLGLPKRDVWRRWNEGDTSLLGNLLKVTAPTGRAAKRGLSDIYQQNLGL